MTSRYDHYNHLPREVRVDFGIGDGMKIYTVDDKNDQNNTFGLYNKNLKRFFGAYQPKYDNYIYIDENKRLLVIDFLKKHNIKCIKEIDENTKQFIQDKLDKSEKKLRKELFEKFNEKVEKVETERRSTRIKNKNIKESVCEAVKKMKESKSEKYKKVTHDMCTHIPYVLKDRWLDFTPAKNLKTYDNKRLRKTSNFINPMKCKNAPIELHIYMYPIFEKIGLIR